MEDDEDCADMDNSLCESEDIEGNIDSSTQPTMKQEQTLDFQTSLAAQQAVPQ